MGFYFVDPETYKKYKDEVMQYSQSVQVNYQEFLPEEKRQPGLSDKQIAEKLGLEERVVREIRVVAARRRAALEVDRTRSADRTGDLDPAVGPQHGAEQRREQLVAAVVPARAVPEALRGVEIGAAIRLETSRERG